MAVGYASVAESDPDTEGSDLGRQSSSLRDWCAARGIDLLCVLEDVVPDASNPGDARRPGLRKAAEAARRAGAPLIVCDVSRIAPETDRLLDLLKRFGVDLISVGERGRGDALVLHRVESVDDIAEAMESDMPVDLSEAETDGVSSNVAVSRRRAAQASAEIRKRKSARITAAIADVLAEDVAYRELSLPALANLLNRKNVLSGWHRGWNAASLRLQRRKAMAELLAREQISDASSASAMSSQPVGIDQQELASRVTKASKKTQHPGVGPVNAKDQHDEMLALPTFGMF